MLKRIANWLNRVAGTQIDIKEEIKKQLHIVQDVIDLDKLEPERKTFLLNLAHDLHVNEFFQLLVKDTKAVQIEATMKGANNNQQLLAGQINVFIAESFANETAKYNTLWEASRETEEFDEQAII